MAISRELPQPSVTKISLKIIYLKYYSTLPGSAPTCQIVLRLQKIYSHFELYLGFGLTQEDEINSGTTLYRSGHRTVAVLLPGFAIK